jgi:NAD-dependent SIR2 family protein deacetylase
MRQQPTNRYVAGDYLQDCDRCSWTYLHSQLKKEVRTGLWVCNRCYDPIHPQDEVKHMPRSEAPRKD